MSALLNEAGDMSAGPLFGKPCWDVLMPFLTQTKASSRTFEIYELRAFYLIAIKKIREGNCTTERAFQEMLPVRQMFVVISSYRQLFRSKKVDVFSIKNNWK